MQKAPADVRPSFMKWLAIPVKIFSPVDTIATYSIDSFYIVLYCIVNKTFIYSYKVIWLVFVYL
jgi:hypothetical protein